MKEKSSEIKKKVERNNPKICGVVAVARGQATNNRTHQYSPLTPQTRELGMNVCQALLYSIDLDTAFSRQF